MSEAAQALGLAIGSFQSGDLPRAEGHCRDALAVDPGNLDATHLLGLVLWRGGRFAAAIECLDAVVRGSPNFAEAHNNRGVVLRDAGRLDEAEASFRRAFDLKPDFADAAFNLGNLFREREKFETAVEWYARAISLNPNAAEAWRLHGVALRESGKPADAEASLREAIRLRPDSAEAFNNLGNALRDLRRLEEAEPCYREALRLNPRLFEAMGNLGVVLQELGKLDEAVAVLRRACEQQPNDAGSIANLAVALRERGEWEAAIALVRREIELDPGKGHRRAGLGMYLLVSGNFAEGWGEFEWRRQVGELSHRAHPRPRWDGGPVVGKTILLQSEQGFGDTLQFVRYAAMLKEAGATVIVESQPALIGVLSRCEGVDRLTTIEAPPVDFDMHCPLMSLPLRFGTDLATIPARVPYLFAEENRTEWWRGWLAKCDGLKVGICWQGNPTHDNDRRRSVRLTEFATLAAKPGVRLVSLQHGFGGEQLDALADRFVVARPPRRSDNPTDAWRETAALIAALDLVITIDSAIAHLAGALGKPVWVLLPFAPDWRWLLDREDSPWYPTMTLFRQKRPGDWADLFERVARRL